jgi:hypothetical protein
MGGLDVQSGYSVRAANLGPKTRRTEGRLIEYSRVKWERRIPSLVHTTQHSRLASEEFVLDLSNF